MSVQTVGLEAAAVALANTLATYLNAKLDAVNAIWNDGLALPHPKKIYDTEMLEVPEYPAILVMNARGRLIEDMAPVYQGMAHQLIIEVLCLSGKHRDLQKMVLRYLLAIQQTVAEHPKLDGTLASCVGTALTDYELTPLAKSRSGPQLMQAGRWLALVQSEERLP